MSLSPMTSRLGGTGVNAAALWISPFRLPRRRLALARAGRRAARLCGPGLAGSRVRSLAGPAPDPDRALWRLLLALPLAPLHFNVLPVYHPFLYPSTSYVQALLLYTTYRTDD